MGDMVEFESNGNKARGYLATPAQGGAAPGVIVVQEWWGLNPQIKRVCDRLAAEGLTALAPDLYHGELAEHTEMDRAAELMNAMPIDRAVRDMSGAVDFLAGHDAVRGDGIGAVGFCMGGFLALLLAAKRPDKLKVVVSYYGVIPDPNQLDIAGIKAAVQGHYGTSDGFMPTDAAHGVEQRLKDAGADTQFHYYDAGHAFANDDNPIGTHDEEHARTAWVRTLEFLRAHLG
jgi:carboxymethylenebutenolidase